MAASTPGERCRVAVWGPGTLGGGCIRRILRRPELDLVAVYAYSSAKSGVDAASSLGLEPCGVEMTCDRTEFMSSGVDVALYCGRDIDDDAAITDMLDLLEAGINVITPQAFHTFFDRGAALEVRFETACQQGRSTFFATGISPGYVVERLMTTLTGITAEVDEIIVEEIFNAELLGSEFLAEYGFGADPELADQLTWGTPDDPRAPHAARYLSEQVPLAAGALGVAVGRIERHSQYDVTERDIELRGGLIQAGTVARSCHSWIGFVDGRSFVTYRCWWFLTGAMRPEGLTEDFIVSIEGRPSVRVGLDITATLGSRKRRYDGDPTPAGYYATLAPMILAIPEVAARPAGIWTTPIPGPHWQPILRQGASQ